MASLLSVAGKQKRMRNPDKQILVARRERETPAPRRQEPPPRAWLRGFSSLHTHTQATSQSSYVYIHIYLYTQREEGVYIRARLISTLQDWLG